MSASLVIECTENNFGQMMTRLEVVDADSTMREKKAVVGLGRLVHLCMEQMAVKTIHSNPSQQEVLKKAFKDAGIEI